MTKPVRLLALLLLLPVTAHAQPAPSNLNGAQWGGAGCNTYTFSSPPGPRATMVDQNGNLCTTVTGTISATTAATAAASLPTLSAGSNPLYESLSGGLYIQPIQGSGIMSATNGGYQNLLQSNAVLSAGNPLFITGAGTAGTPATNPVTVQGISGGTTIPVTDTPLAITPVTASTTLESSHILKGSAGNFFGVQVNTTSASEWVMLFNATTAPADGAVTPAAWWQVNASSTLSISEMPGLALSTGIVLVCSTTGPFTKTASALCTFGAGTVQ